MNHDRCDGISRRSLLTAGVLGPLGWTLSDIVANAAMADTKHGAIGGINRPAKSMILIWLDGGLSHLDSFDPKPNAPSEIRGPFATLPTRISGTRISEHLPLMAQQLHHCTLVRSLTHELGNHDTGGHLVLTGHRANPATAYPSIGSIVANMCPGQEGMPAYAVLGRMADALGEGYLPSKTRPFHVKPGTTAPGTILTADGKLSNVWNRRLSSLGDLTRLARALDTAQVTPKNSATTRALAMLTSPKVLAAFNIEREPYQTRQTYGTSTIGQNCLLARRMVDGGCPVVQIVDSGYDTHVDIHRELPDTRFPGSGKLPALDKALSALISDLVHSGAIETTIVAVISEFGRTPKLNASAGRDHWPRAGSLLLAGGPFKKGLVYGETDANGESPIINDVSPADIAATLLHAIGIDASVMVPTPDGRSIARIAQGRPVQEIFR